MKKKMFVVAVTLSLLLSGMLAVVGGETRKEQVTYENNGEAKKTSLPMDPELHNLTIHIEGQGKLERESYDMREERWVTDMADINDDFDKKRPHGKRINLTAVPEDGWEFDKWTGDVPEGEEGKDIQLNITEDTEITAKFAEEDDDDDGMPGFTLTLLFSAAVIAVAVYYEKER